MKKTITLLMFFFALVSTAKASEELAWNSFSIWETESVAQGTWNSSTKSFTVTTNYGGAQIWYAADKSAFDVLVLEIKSVTGKFQINIESKPTSGDNTKVTEDIFPSTEPQYLIMTLDANKSNLQKVEVKLNQDYSEGSSTIVFGDAYFMTSSEATNMPMKKTLNMSDLNNGWDSSYDSSTKTITFNAGWKGRGWGINATRTNYDKVVVDFAEALPYGVRMMVEYSGTYSKSNETKNYSAYADADEGATSICVPINTADNYNTSINQIYLQNKTEPNSKTVKLKRAYIANNHFYLLDEDVNPDYTSTTYYTTSTSDDASNTRTFNHTAHVDLTRTLKSGWNTICLPFTTTATAIATGAEVYTYTSATKDAVTLTKVDGGAMTAGTPYMLKITGSAPSSPITFSDVTISVTTAGATSEANGLTFKGNYSAGMNMENKYGLVNSSSSFKKGSSTATLPAFAAYFDGTKPNSAPSRGFSIEVGDGTTGIDAMERVVEEDNSPTYNLMGQQTTTPRKGIYIKNGKKYIAK